MKRIYLIVTILLLSVTSAHSTTIPLDSIKRAVACFLKEVERARDPKPEDYTNFMFYDRVAQDTIQENKEGIFIFNILSSGERIHLLLVGKDNFQILNMNEPLDVNILKLVDFFERNENFDRRRILLYLRDLVRTYRRNEEYIQSFGGLIK